MTITKLLSPKMNSIYIYIYIYVMTITKLLSPKMNSIYIYNDNNKIIKSQNE